MTIRDGRRADVPVLREIERRAAAAFAATARARLATPRESELLPSATLAAAVATGDLLVVTVDGAAVGFALLGRLGSDAQLRELDVLPEHGGRGLGGALLEAACARAAGRGCARIVLTTFREVPFNGPFYARHGFVELDPDGTDGRFTPELGAILDAEAAAGLDRAARCAMARDLAAEADGQREEGQ
mgnify:CR=1 FL=1